MWPRRSRSVRLLVRNVPSGTSEEALRRHFEAATGPGEVLDVAFDASLRSPTLKGFSALVRMRDEAAGERARRDLDLRSFRGLWLSIHRFVGFKIYVGGLPQGCTQKDLRPLFQKFGPVSECYVVKDYAFVHMDNEEDGKAAIEHLNAMELKGKRIIVKRSVKDRKPNDGKRNDCKQNFEQKTRVGGDTFPDPYYGDQPPALVDQDYRPQLTTGQAASYRNGVESEDNSYLEASRGRTHSAQSYSYGSKSYDNHNAVYKNQAAYDMQDDTAASYSMQFSDSLSTHDRASVDVAYQPGPDQLASTDSETASRHLLYERVRLSPRRISYDDLYRDKHAVKRYTTKQADGSYCPSYEFIRLSSTHSSHNNFDKRGNGSSKKYTARSENASRYTEGSGSASRDTEGLGSPCYTERSGNASQDTERLKSASRYTERLGSASCDTERLGSASHDAERLESASRYTERSGSASHYTERLGSASHYTGRLENSSRYTERSGNASRNTERLESASQDTGRLESVSRYTGRLENTFRYTERSGNASCDTERLRSTSHYKGRLESASRYTERSENASRDTERSENASRDTERLGSASHYKGRLETASQDTERLENVSRLAEILGSASHYTGRLESASRYTERPGRASRHRPYERSYLSPPHRSRENQRSYR